MAAKPKIIGLAYHTLLWDLENVPCMNLCKAIQTLDGKPNGKKFVSTQRSRDGIFIEAPHPMAVDRSWMAFLDRGSLLHTRYRSPIAYLIGCPILKIPLRKPGEVGVVNLNLSVSSQSSRSVFAPRGSEVYHVYVDDFGFLYS